MSVYLTSTSLAPAAVSMALALATSWLLEKRFGAPSEAGRFATIDGLRGYLAFFVYIFHASAWQLFRRTGEWRPPPSNLYAHFGQSSVLLFFMITAFLFFTKILDAKAKPIDWLRLFVSRVLRLTPLYAFAMCLLLLVVAVLSDFSVREPHTRLLIDSARWIGFTIFGTPDLNGFDSTWLIMAGVTWSLPYEWMFYFSLPLLAIAASRQIPTVLLVVVGGVGVIGFIAIHSVIWYLMAFVGGIVAAVLARSPTFGRMARRRSASMIVLGSLAVVVLSFDSPRHLLAMALLTLSFSLIASGTSLFGLFEAGVSRTFGELSYSIYLLHGFVLFAMFRLLMTPVDAAGMTTMTHWAYIVVASPVVVLLSFLTYRFIELPPMLLTASLTARIRHGLSRRRRA